MRYIISIQNTIENDSAIPSSSSLRQWAHFVLSKKIKKAEICIRIVSTQESKELNCRYRQKDYPTNVLSFSCELPQGIKLATPYLGDIILCADVIKQEAEEQEKSLEAHWAHMVIHGTLHLLGYDHIKEHEANEMEKLETDLLSQLSYPPPYGDLNE